jgi:hypothetical protein
MAEETKIKIPFLHLSGKTDPIYYKPLSDKPDNYEPLDQDVYLNAQYVFRIDAFEGVSHIYMANGEFYRVKTYTVKNM